MNLENTSSLSHKESQVKKAKSLLLSKKESEVSMVKFKNGDKESPLTLVNFQTPTPPLINLKPSGVEEEEILVDLTKN